MDSAREHCAAFFFFMARAGYLVPHRVWIALLFARCLRWIFSVPFAAFFTVRQREHDVRAVSHSSNGCKVSSLFVRWSGGATGLLALGR